jgi:hypothetical protein
VETINCLDLALRDRPIGQIFDIVDVIRLQLVLHLGEALSGDCCVSDCCVGRNGRESIMEARMIALWRAALG